MTLWFPFLLLAALSLLLAAMLVSDCCCPDHGQDHEPDDRIDSIRCPECGDIIPVIYDKE